MSKNDGKKTSQVKRGESFENRGSVLVDASKKLYRIRHLTKCPDGKKRGFDHLITLANLTTEEIEQNAIANILIQRIRPRLVNDWAKTDMAGLEKHLSNDYVFDPSEFPAERKSVDLVTKAERLTSKMTIEQHAAYLEKMGLDPKSALEVAKQNATK